MVMVDTRVWVTRLMVDNDESGVLTEDMTINMSSLSAMILGQRGSQATIMSLKSAIVHSFFPASSNGCIASTHLTSDSPICPACLFQSTDMTSFKLLQLLVMKSNPAASHFFNH
ncbi:hypothetical protein TNCV_1175611 [Trichonephila clavipes]|nr:hypothetical protein TNCV_1175611 [Trichonephila clavipes]